MAKDISDLSKVATRDINLFIGGKDRKLVFGFRAARVLQEKFGSITNAMNGLAAVSENVEVAVDMLYALLSIDKTVTREQVSEWAEDLESMFEIILKIKDVITNHAPVASDDPTTPTGK